VLLLAPLPTTNSPLLQLVCGGSTMKQMTALSKLKCGDFDDIFLMFF
jgi:hypothetical protein